jgi:hypothetical protein
MVEYVKNAHTAIFSGPTRCGKTQRLLDLIENEYRNHFDNIVILCPTLRRNVAYLERSWVWKDPYVFLIEPKDELIRWIEALSVLFEGEETLFIIDDCIGDEDLNKTRSALLDTSVIGRHMNHYLWMLTQRYKKIPLTVRDQLKQLWIWYPKNRNEFELIHNENHIIESQEEIKHVKNQLKDSKHGCLYLRMEYPRSYNFLH